MAQFKLDIVDQHWIDRDPNNTTDVCSHGSFLLSINGQSILSREDDIDDWTTSTSVLRLLKTIDDDFLENRDVGIILHCGMLEMISCPISLDWQLWHYKGKIFIKDIKKYLTTNEVEVIEYPEIIAAIPEDEYRNEVLKVALQVKSFFATSKPRQYFDHEERLDNIRFWKEFDSLILKHY